MRLSPLLTLLAVSSRVLALDFVEVPDWAKKQAGRTQIGNMHGDVAVSSTGDVYISVMDPKAGVQVYGPDGAFVRNVPDAPSDFHGFVIHKNADGEFLYGARLGSGDILKMSLDGKIVLQIPPTAIPDEFKNKGKDGKPTVRLTAMDVAPSGDLFVTDGYSSDYIHRFDKTGKYLATVGGKKEPYNFKTLHKIAIDTRFDPPRIIGCDRANGRVVHLELDGKFIGVVAKDMMLPAAVAVQGEYAVVGELKGQVTVLDKEGKVAVKFGTNTVDPDAGSNKTPPDQWKPGLVTAPHGVAFDAKGNIYVSEYNLYGRVHRFDRK